MAYAVLVGASLGFGLLAKYAAVYFFLCVGDRCRGPTSARATRCAAGRGGRSALVIALALVAPNLVWNASHGFATFAHTAGNAGWKGLPIHIGSGLEFLGAQFAVFGPILFAVLIYVAGARCGGAASSRNAGCSRSPCRCFCLLIVQALLSRALANWAAAAYPAGDDPGDRRAAQGIGRACSASRSGCISARRSC